MNKTSNLRLNINLKHRILGLKGSNEFQDIRREIFCCTDGESIIELLKLKTMKYDQSVYTAAMTKCGELGDIENTYKIMKFMRKSKIKRDRNSYNILFRALAINERAYEYIKYIKYMSIKDNIKPDIITATTLIGGCKKRGDIETSENIWNDIIIKFDLKPTEITYIEILNVYAKAANSNKAQIKFKEMIESGIKPNEESCGALMKCFANCLDINNVLKIKLFMELKGLKRNSYIYASLMKVYLKTKMPLKALEVYNEYKITLNGNAPHKSLLHSRNCTFLSLLEENVKNGIDDINTKHYYNMVTKTTIDEIKQFYGTKSKIIKEMAHNLLQAIVLYHYNLRNDEQKTIQLFQNLCQESQIGYWSQDYHNNKWMLDFHFFTYNTSKFVLHYVFKYEKHNILDMDEIMILCGRGYHRNKYVITNNSNNSNNLNERGLMYFIQHELANWSPVPIRSQRYLHNYAVLKLCKHDVLAYFKTHSSH